MKTTKYLFAFLIFLSFDSCHDKNKNSDPMIETFLTLIEKSKQVTIAFGKTKVPVESIRDTTITNDSEIKDLKEYIRQSVKSDSCYDVYGTITFINDSRQNFSIDFGCRADCPAFYFYVEGKPLIFTMPEGCRIYLTVLEHFTYSNNASNSK